MAKTKSFTDKQICRRVDQINRVLKKAGVEATAGEVCGWYIDQPGMPMGPSRIEVRLRQICWIKRIPFPDGFRDLPPAERKSVASARNQRIQMIRENAAKSAARALDKAGIPYQWISRQTLRVPIK